jgi:signal transduction histidine kinase
LVRAFQNLNVSLNLTNREISIFADPHALQIIFKNIIENSIKHSKSNIPRFEVQVEEITNKPFILLWVRDFGEGASIPLRQAGNLFVKGQDSSGAGVGLFLIRQLMKQMGGECTWKNDSGFWVGLKFRYE